MDVFCINTNNPEFLKLLAESGEKQGVFAMTISKWMTESGIHNRYPTLQELGITAMESAKPGVQELFDSTPELANAVYEALGFEIPTTKLEGRKLEYDELDNPIITFFDVTKELTSNERKNLPSSILINKLLNGNFLPKINETDIVLGVTEGGIWRPNLKKIEASGNNKSTLSKKIAHELLHSVTGNIIISYQNLKGDFDFTNKYALDQIKQGYIKPVKLNDTQIEALDNLVRLRNKVINYIKQNKESLIKKDRGFGNYDYFINTNYTDKDSDLHEFISEVFSNPELINILKEIPTEGKKSNLFKDFVDAIAKILGFNNTSILEDIIAYSEEAFFAQPQITPQQKQQALQLYSQYLNTIFPDSKVTLSKKFADIYNIVFNGETIGTIDIPSDLEGDTISIGDVNIKPEFRGKGLGIETYKAAMAIAGKPLESFMATDEANRVWNSLIKQGLAKKTDTGFVTISPLLGSKQDIKGFKEFLDKPATSEEIAKESVDVMQKSIQKLEKDGLADDSRKILKPFDFNAYNEKLTNHARNKYGVTGEGMLFKIVESKSSLPYDRLIGYNKSTFYDVNNELFKELQEKYDAYHSSEGKSGYYQLKDSTNLKQADKDLDTYLLDFLKPFGVKSQEVEELKTRLGKDALALTDVLNKVIYHVNSDKLNALSIPEEASHMIVMLMGKHNPLIKELLDNIHKWDKYESIKKLYLPEYQNLAQVKIEAVGQLLSEALVRNNLKPAAKSMFKTIIDNISKWLKEKFSKFQSQLFIADKIAVEVLNGNADFIGNLKPAYPKVDFEKALNGNPLAKKLVTDFASELKLPLVGSLAIAGQNETIYRSEKEPVHDLDFLQDGRKTSISRKLDKKLKELNAVEAHKGWPSPDKTYTCFTYFIPAEGYTIIPTNINKSNWVTEFEIHKEGKLFVSLRYYWVKDGKGKLTRTLLTSFENPADSKTDLSQIYMPTDFFFYPKGYSEKTSANNMAHWTSIYNGKMLLSPESRKERMFDRPKDQNDYLLLNPEDRSKKPTEAFMYYQISDEDVIEDLIQEGKLKTKCE